MKKQVKTTNRIKYLLNNKIIKNIKKGVVRYSIDDMKNDLKEIRTFLNDRGLYYAEKKVNSVIRKMDNFDHNRNDIMKLLDIISKAISMVSEKHQVMEIREIEKRREYFNFTNKMMKKKEKYEQIQKYDVVNIPTQGGYHHSIVYDILDNGMIVCYPITTAKGNDLRLLGNSWYTLKDCGCTQYNGNQLSSAAAFVTKERAAFCKEGHITNYEEVDRAISQF